MSDMSSMSRKEKKNQLRRQMISSGPKDKKIKQEESSEKIISKAHNRVLRRRFLTFIIIIGLAAAAVFGVRQYFTYHQYTSYKTAWEKPVSEGGASGYAPFGSNVIKYTKDGVSYIDGQGKTVWMQSYEMKNPVISVNGGYAVIADVQGNQIAICSESGYQGTATTALPVIKAAVSQNGIVAAILEDSRASYIQYYKKDGTDMQLTVKSVLSGDGYPLDIALSPDGTRMIASIIHLEKGELLQRVVIYDFSEIGKNENYVVGGMDEEFAGSMVAKVIYPTSEEACAFADTGLSFFSMKNLTQISLTKQVKVEESIESIFYSDQYAGMIVQNTSGENPYRMDVYKLSGDLVFSREFDFQYREAGISGDYVILFNETACRIYNMQGVLIYDGEIDTPPGAIVSGKYPGTFIISGSQMMKEIKLQ
ncbi:DUF5711 family protein [Lachnoclostridium edouardi]|uniref:DUF5711 family protein n=1 Tax=Lachnoclostridium edouardi TaxID=1926283 RepID=UPI000C7BF302|nr:DUF5711 family protein [Lachnoclostridium edouardi]